MGNLDADTSIEPVGDDRYRATLSQDWAMWGPNGGYLAAIALRAAGAATALSRPATLTCGFIGSATFDPVELQVARLRAGRRAELLRVEMFQGAKQILSASVWTVADGLPGPDRQWSDAPSAPPPLELSTMEDLVVAAGGTPLTLWRNYEVRPIGEVRIDPDRPAAEPKGQAWLRFREQATFPGDPWLDAGRCAVAADITGFPTVARGFAARELAFIAPTVDLHLTFHGATPAGEWLLVESEGLAAGGGLVGARARIWSPGVGLVASGGQQLLVTVPRSTQTVPHSSARP
ncbi:thioesterase family protein [Solihabitans fulvus]|uniref:Thioesterase family protein n=1 Tax=Solihabitans fulvus TaxID=1892852 RepID=A0A5B2XEJ7_9PSEU|nr:thioesterase family protein [Solihabitans fulvus]KAA2261381.1 thioesterase family protein [Solihabitans fulvus]